MAIIPVPAGAEFTNLVFEPDFPAQVNRTEWARGRKVVGLPGLPKWFIKGVLKLQSTETSIRLWRSFKMKLRGVENTFKIPVLTGSAAQIPSANPTVVSVSANGLFVVVSSAANLKEGMYGTVALPSGHHRLFVLSADPISTLLSIQPELPETPTAGTAIEFRAPYALVAQIETRGGWEDSDGNAFFAFDTEEAY